MRVHREITVSDGVVDCNGDWIGLRGKAFSATKEAVRRGFWSREMRFGGSIVCFSRRKADIFAAIEAETVSHDCGSCLEYANYFKLSIAVVSVGKDPEVVGAVLKRSVASFEP